ncbi:hypothetical protein [Salinimicrobium xinjiangense]|uniref:hypothetical protein n=1 Tax=Salinimicrobium xinjiangense TaxID=438596 RepID=UPI0003F731D7|nr:hypothetical protein [Salinimicrobium xinjiangense]
MKSGLYLFIIILLCSSCSTDDSGNSEVETVPKEKYYHNPKTFSTQADVDDFAKQEYNVITGNLVFIGESITDLSGLKSIHSIRGDLMILATSIENLDGLENVNLIDKAGISLNKNSLLKDISGLRSISVLLSYLEIEDSPELITLTGLEGIVGVTHNLFLTDLPKIKSLDPLSKIGNPLLRLTLSNLGIVNTNGVSKIPSVESMYVLGNPYLSNANFTELTRVDNLNIGGNPLLEDLSGLNNLQQANELNIINNTSLKNLDGLNNLDTSEILNMKIWNNIELADYCGLRDLAAKGKLALEARDNLYNPTSAQVAGDECNL